MKMQEQSCFASIPAPMSIAAAVGRAVPQRMQRRAVGARHGVGVQIGDVACAEQEDLEGHGVREGRGEEGGGMTRKGEESEQEF